MTDTKVENVLNRAVGKKLWAIAGGNIPFGATGQEPEFTSHDSLSILNATPKDADIEIVIFYSDREPVGPYELSVGARRVREIRFNDLIDPQAIPLETPYAAVISSSVEIVVHAARMDTRQAANARMALATYFDTHD